MKALRLQSGELAITKGVSLELRHDVLVRPGEVVGLSGENGSGKSLAMSVVAGAIRSKCLRVVLCGVDVSRWSIHRRSRFGLSRLHQQTRNFDDWTVRENLEFRCTRFSSTGCDRNTVVQAIAAKFALTDVLEVKCCQLSGGMARQVAVAAALGRSARIVLLDEPFAGLDGVLACRALKCIRDAALQKVAVLLIDHDRSRLRGLANRVYEADALSIGEKSEWP